MAEYQFFQIDAFAERPMGGGPAAVMPMDVFPADSVMQAVAAENNLAETAFIVAKGKGPREQGVFDLRWFTPGVEVPLCGHATLASAHALFSHLGFDGTEIGFDTKSGRLTVKRLADGRLEMDFPADPPKRIDAPAGLAEALGVKPKEVWQGQYLLAVFGSADEVRALKPDLAKVAALGGRRMDVCCAAPGASSDSFGMYDVVSRFFAPADGIPEDPATGSAHCMIAPYFSERLGKPELTCFQAYPGRGADITTRMAGDRVKLIGRARTVIEGVFRI
jgi:PhzF family phenazine biosynthesis protein